MRHFAISTMFVLATTTSLGCGLLGGGGGAQQPGNAQSSGAAYKVPQESKDAVRKQEKTAYEASEAAEDEALDKKEKDALKVLSQALGKSSAHNGGQVPE